MLRIISSGPKKSTPITKSCLSDCADVRCLGVMGRVIDNVTERVGSAPTLHTSGRKSSPLSYYVATTIDGFNTLAILTQVILVSPGVRNRVAASNNNKTNAAGYKNRRRIGVRDIAFIAKDRSALW